MSTETVYGILVTKFEGEQILSGLWLLVREYTKEHKESSIPCGQVRELIRKIAQVVEPEKLIRDESKRRRS